MRRFAFRRAIWKDILQGGLIGAGIAFLLTFFLAESAVHAGTSTINGWQASTVCGVAGSMELEAGCALVYPAVNSSDEAIYWTTGTAGTPTLDGTKTYVMHFTATGLPPVGAFWSITTGDARTRLMVTNPQHKYSVSSHSGLATATDGSIDVYLAPTLPAGAPTSNWLPTPAGTFMLWLRLYEPTSSTWTPPAIKQVQR